MFTWLNKQGVHSDKGFDVQFTGRFDAEYREGDKVVSLYVEAGLSEGMPTISVDPTSFERWDGDPPGVVIATDQQARMFNNLREAFEFQGLRLKIESTQSS